MQRTRSRTTAVMPAPIRQLWHELSGALDPAQRAALLSFGQGVPFFGPPAAAVEALTAQLQTDPAIHRYAPDEGRSALRRACCAKLARVNGIDLGPDWRQRLVVTAGANQGFIDALGAITHAGDAVAIMTPYYFNHEMAIRLLDCTPILVPTGDDYQPDLTALERIFGTTPNLRAVVTISPNNPTGAVYPRSTLARINDLCRRAGCWHISDETYEYFVYDDADGHVSPAALDGALDHTIALHTFSKSYGMPGWRVGYLVAPPRLFDELIKIQDTVIITANRAAQELATRVLEFETAGAARTVPYPRRFLPRLRCFRDRLRLLVSRYGTAAGAAGAFYLMPRFPRSQLTGQDLHRRLATEYGLFVLPGEVFGADHTPASCSLRLAFGNLDDATFDRAYERLEAGLDALIGTE